MSVGRALLCTTFFRTALAGTLAEYQIEHHRKELEGRSKIKTLSDLEERRDNPHKELAAALAEEEEEEGDEGECDPNAPIFKKVIIHNRNEMIVKGAPKKVVFGKGDGFDAEPFPACGRFEGSESCCTKLYFQRAVQIMTSQAKMIKETRNKIKKSFSSVFEKAMANEGDSLYGKIKEAKDALLTTGWEKTIDGFFTDCQGELLRFFSITACQICSPDLDQYLVDESKLKMSKEHCDVLHKKCKKYPAKFMEAAKSLTKYADKFAPFTTKGEDYLNNEAYDNLHGFLGRTAAAFKSIAGHIENYEKKGDFCGHVASEGYIFRPAWTSSGAAALHGKHGKGTEVDWGKKGKNEGEHTLRNDQFYHDLARNKGPDQDKPNGVDDDEERKPEVTSSGRGYRGSDKVLEDGIDSCQNGGVLEDGRCRCTVCWTGRPGHPNRCEVPSPAGPPYNQQFSPIVAERPHVFRIRVCAGHQDQINLNLARIKFILPPKIDAATTKDRDLHRSKCKDPECKDDNYEVHDSVCQATSYEEAPDHFIFLKETVSSAEKDDFLRYDLTYVSQDATGGPSKGLYSVCFCEVFLRGKCDNKNGAKWLWAGTIAVVPSLDAGLGRDIFMKMIGNVAEAREVDRSLYEGSKCGYGWLYSRFINVKIVQHTEPATNDKYLQFECPQDGDSSHFEKVGPAALKCVTDPSGDQSKGAWHFSEGKADQQALEWNPWDGEHAPECIWKYVECHQPVQMLDHGKVEAQNGRVEYICDEGYEISLEGFGPGYGSVWIKQCEQGSIGGDWGWKCQQEKAAQWASSGAQICQVHPKCEKAPKKDSSSLIGLSRGALIEQEVHRSALIDPQGMIKRGVEGFAPGSLLQSQNRRAKGGNNDNGKPLTGSGRAMGMPSKPTKKHLRIYRYDILFADGGYKLDVEAISGPSVDEVADKGSSNGALRISMVDKSLLASVLIVAYLWASSD